MRRMEHGWQQLHQRRELDDLYAHKSSHRIQESTQKYRMARVVTTTHKKKYNDERRDGSRVGVL